MTRTPIGDPRFFARCGPHSLATVAESRATATLAGRIASPEMLPERGLLPHLKCSPGARRSGGGNEAGEHGDA